MMIRQQDQTIDTIAGTLNTLQEQAGLMGREIHEHNECVPLCLYLSGYLLSLHVLLLTTVLCSV